MDDDHDLKDFGNVSRLFPLPGVVLFPHAILPTAHLRAAIPPDDRGRPGGRSVHHDRPGPPAGGVDLADRADPGGSRLPRPDLQARAAGRRPVQLPPPGPQAGPADPRGPHRQALPDGRGPRDRGHPGRGARGAAPLRADHPLPQALRRQPRPRPRRPLRDRPPLGRAHRHRRPGPGLPASVKQTLLGEPRIGKRAGDLIELLRQVGPTAPSADDEGTSFPPAFSRN